MSLADVITTRRLRLPLITPEEARAGLAGQRDPSWHRDYPRDGDLVAFSFIGEPSPWDPRHVVRAWDGLVCGSIGFHGPPTEHEGVLEVEVGYGLVEEARGHGIATEALLAIVAATDEAGVRVTANVEPDNAASIRVLAKCGFTELRAPTDDGELVFARPLC